MHVGEESLIIMAKAGWYNRWLYTFIKPYLGKKILELGSGIGNFTELLADGRRFVTASDIEEKYLKKLRFRFKNKNVRVVKLDLEKGRQKLDGGPFDTAVCLNVLEHIKKDKAALRSIYKNLKKEGKLILLVPAHPILDGSLDVNLGHKRRYAKTEVVTKLKGTGFKIEKIRYLNFFGAFGWFLNSRILKRKIISESQVGMFNRLAKPALLAEKAIKPPLGLSIFVVAKK